MPNIDQSLASKLKIIFLSKNMAQYDSAHYQQDVIEEFKRQHLVFFYGEGFPGHDFEDRVEDVIRKSPWEKPDLIIIGHTWLGDNQEKSVDTHPNLHFDQLSIPTAIILNKEYVLLKEKLDYVYENKIPLLFSHSQKINNLVDHNKVEAIFWPFAANHHVFYLKKTPKKYDLTFTGLLRNAVHTEQQSDFRVRVQQKLFAGWGEVRLWKKWKYSHLRLYWDGIPRSQKLFNFYKKFYGKKRLNTNEYAKLLAESRICLCALSPFDLISPRYFEAMASECLVLCQRTDEYGDLFTDMENVIMVNDDLSDFDEKLNYALRSNAQVARSIVGSAYRYVMENHTWEKRIQQFTAVVVHYFNQSKL